MKKVPKDFPFSDSSSNVDTVDNKKMKIEDDLDSSFLKQTCLIDENEIDKILQKVNNNNNNVFQNDQLSGSSSGGGGGGEGGTDFDVPICEVEFDIDFH